MCLSDLGSNCGSDYIVSQGFTEAQKTEMLQIHNDLRAKVASGSANGLPTAGNLKKSPIFTASVHHLGSHTASIGF